jgi:hypothetical protein
LGLLPVRSEEEQKVVRAPVPDLFLQKVERIAWKTKPIAADNGARQQRVPGLF